MAGQNREWLSRAASLQKAGRHAEAERIVEEALRLHPGDLDALDMLAGLLLQSGLVVRAVEIISQVIALAPRSAAAWSNMGYALSLLGRLEEALAAYDAALAISADFTAAHYSRAIVLGRLGRHEDAREGFARTLALNPDHAAAWVGHGTALCDIGRFGDALESFGRALALRPQDANAHYNRGNALNALGRLRDALADYDRTIALDPAHAEAHNNRGSVLASLKDYAGALASYDRAIALKPDYAEALDNRGNALNELRRHAEALASHDAALALRPDSAPAHNNRGLCLFDLGRLEDALASYDSAIARDPHFADAHYNRAIALTELKRPENALDAYRTAFALKADAPYLHGKYVHAKMALCDWSDLDSLRSGLAQKIARGEKASPPFPLLSVFDDPTLHRKAAEIYARDRLPQTAKPPFANAARRSDKIHVGYFSADFHDHATAVLMAELFEKHNRGKFEWTAFSFGPDREDAMRRRVVAAFDRFIDVQALSDAEVAGLARSLGLDIAVDLKGYTGGARDGIFAHRAAPIQASYLGYPGTMSSDAIDYLIADGVLISPGDRRYYSEKIVTLPDCYQPNDTTRRIDDVTPARRECGLPEHGFVFCCFNASYKITPEVFDVWMRILGRVDGSVLWLLESNARVAENLRSEAERRGVDSARLVFAPRMAVSKHLARHRLADLFLDTLPYNAHTTASDALWAGLPVLTCAGKTFAGRVATSLLHALNLAELVTASAEEFQARAVELAQSPEALAAIRRKLSVSRPTTPLFDIRRFTGHLEAAFAAMFHRMQMGLGPDHLDVARLADGSEK